MEKKKPNPARNKLVSTLKGEPEKLVPTLTLEKDLIDKDLSVGDKLKLSLETEVSAVMEDEQGSRITFKVNGVSINNEQEKKEEITPTEE